MNGAPDERWLGLVGLSHEQAANAEQSTAVVTIDVTADRKQAWLSANPALREHHVAHRGQHLVNCRPDLDLVVGRHVVIGNLLDGQGGHPIRPDIFRVGKFVQPSPFQ
jgi:hypothetical protein